MHSTSHDLVTGLLIIAAVLIAAEILGALMFLFRGGPNSDEPVPVAHLKILFGCVFATDICLFAVALILVATTNK